MTADAVQMFSKGGLACKCQHALSGRTLENHIVKILQCFQLKDVFVSVTPTACDRKDCNP